MKSKMHPRCAVYARLSSDTHDRRSIQEQIRACQKAATQAGWIVATIACEPKNNYEPFR